MWEIAALCLFDFPANEWITIDVYGPDRNYLSSLVFRAIPEDYDYYDLVSQDGGFVGRGWDIDGKILMEIDIWDSTTIPMGEWYATAASDTKYVEGAFEVLIAEEDLPHVSIGPDVRYDPFYSYASYKNYSAGESVVISGIGFDSHQSITIGIYYGGNEPYLSYDSNLLVYSQAVTADARGNVSLKLTVEANDREGLYVVVLSTDDFDDGNSVFTDGSRIFRIRRPAQINCPGAAQTRLNVRYYAQVTFTDGTASSIREAPASSTIVGRVPEGTGMYIVGGPECHNQLVWWRVQTDNGHEGWVAEGRPGDYWLEPVD